MDFPYSVVSGSESDTAETARQFAAYLQIGDVVLMNGDLGAGKTFFVKAVCAEFGIKNVSSPSFAIVNEYSGSKNVNHLDFYRIQQPKELIDIGFKDYLNDETITFIEWADMFPEVLPLKYFRIDIEFVNETSRKLTIIRNG